MHTIQLPSHISAGHMQKPRLDIYFPRLVGMADAGVQQAINNTILNLVNTMVRDQGYYKDPRTEITGWYEIKTNERGVLSLSLINEAYAGGIHGLRIIKSLTMDMNTGRVYILKDLFKPGSDYIKRLSSLVAKQISDRGIYLLGPYKGVRPDQDYYIADKSIVIYYQLYQLTSYAFGIPHFPISIYDVKDIIDDKGPLVILMY